MSEIVVKFGGSSLADAAQILKVRDILLSDPNRRVLVVSAPGKRYSADEKVTDLLYAVYDKAEKKEDFSEELAKVRTRYEEIVQALKLKLDLSEEFKKIDAKLKAKPERDYTASRGEYLNAKVLAELMGWDFLDAAELICFSSKGVLLEKETNKRMAQAMNGGRQVVLPGFYGAMPDGTIRTFSRGGSDVTGSLAARAVHADLYENWTDVSGMLFTDPRIVKDPVTIKLVTYKELRELSYMGASVLHEDAVFPVRKAGIPINIRNTNRPQDAGTMIVPNLPEGYEPGPITGIAGKKGFANVYVEKSRMNAEVGFGARLLQIFADCRLPFEHCPTGIDTMAVVTPNEEFQKKKKEVLKAIRTKLHPDVVKVETDLAVIAVVGAGIVGHYGIAARVFKAVAEANVNVLMIDSGAGEMNIILSVHDEDYEAAVRAIYEEFAHDEN